MNEKEIDDAWEVYKLTIQDSSYMQRLTMSQREKDFKAGYKAAYEFLNK